MQQLLEAVVGERKQYIKEIEELKQSYKELELNVKKHEARNNKLQKVNALNSQHIKELKQMNGEFLKERSKLDAEFKK